MIVAVLGIFLYPVGIPLFIFLTLYRHRAFLYHDTHALEEELQELKKEQDRIEYFIEAHEGPAPAPIIQTYVEVEAAATAKHCELEQVWIDWSWAGADVDAHRFEACCRGIVL